MSIGKRKLESALTETLDSKSDKPEYISALLGAYLNGLPTIVVAGRPDYVWCRLRGQTSERVLAFNAEPGVAHHWDLPILVTRDPKYPNIWKVAGRDLTAYQDWGDQAGPYMPPHGVDHSFSGAPRTGNDIAWIFKRQFMPLIPTPQVTGTLAIDIGSDFYFFDGRYHWFDGTGTASLSSYLPTGAHNAKFVTIYIDGAEGTLKYLDGGEFNGLVPPIDPGSYISIPTSAQGIAIAAVWMMTGTTSITWPNIYDLRLPATPMPGSGTYPAGTDGQVQYNNAGNFGGATNLYYDDVNDRVGIGESSPDRLLDITGIVRIDGDLEFEGAQSIITTADDLSLIPAGDIVIGSDLDTDRWLSSDTNTLIGIAVAGAGNLSHVSGNNGWYNTYFGNRVGFASTVASFNVGVGFSALDSITSGVQNVAVGTYAGYTLTTTDRNVFIGYQAAYTSAGDNNVVIGVNAAYAMDAQDGSVIIGAYAADAVNFTGADNTIVGHYGASALTSGHGNVVVGDHALFSATTGYGNTALGYNAGYTNISGFQNVYVGREAGETHTGDTSVFIGRKAGENAAGQDGLVIIGANAADAASFTATGITAVGFSALTALTSGNANTALGQSALASLTTSPGNTALGYQAGLFVSTGTGRGTFVGYQAGDSVTSGADNTLIGYEAGQAITTGVSNTFVGVQSGANVTGNYNVAVGALSMLGAVSGDENFALGYNTMSVASTGDSNVAIGARALQDLTTGGSNIAIGHNALQNATTAGGNLAIGSNAAGGTVADDLYNVSIGFQAHLGSTDGDGKVAIGFKAGYSNTDNYTISIGYETMQNGAGGQYTIAIGYRAGRASTGTLNTFIGTSAGTTNTAGFGNVALGTNSMFSNLTGDYITALGYAAGFSTTGNHGIFIGLNAGYYGTSAVGSVIIGAYAADASGFSGARNTVVGYYGASALTTGYDNVVVGDHALFSNTVGFENTAIGADAGYSNTTGSASVFIGYQAGYSETVGSRLYISNSNTATPLIYGEFDNGLVTINGNLHVGSANHELRFYEGANYVGFEAPALSADQIWVLPNADGPEGAILATDGSGNLEWDLNASEKSWAFMSRDANSGVNYVGGYYKFETSDNDFNPAVTLGTANASYAAHFFLVQAAGASGGTDTVIRITGTSITDAGVRNAGATEDLTVDDAGSAGDYYETSKKWIGQVSIEKQSGPDLLCNYGFCKYWDNNNSDFKVMGFEATWLGAKNDATPDILLRHHTATGWTYNNGAAPTPPAAIASMATDHNTEIQIRTDEEGAWKRDNLSTAVNGGVDEGVMIELLTTTNRTYAIGNFILRIVPQ